MRTILPRLLALSLCLFLLPFAACKKDLSNAVAVVNGEVITKTRYQMAQKSFASRLGMPGNPEMLDTPEVRKLIMDNLVGVELLHQAALKAGYNASSEAVDRVFDDFRKNFPSEEVFQTQLTENGMTVEMLKEDIGRQVVLEAYADKGLGIPSPTEEEIQAFYKENVTEKVRASHILIPLSDKPTSAEKKVALDKAKKVRSRALKGEDFGALAKEFSSDPGSASKGGDLGLFSRGQMVKPFDEAAFSQPVDEIGEPILSEYGYHIIKVTERKPAAAIEEVRESIVEFLKRPKLQEALEKKVEELKKTAEIQILLPEPAPALSPGETEESEGAEGGEGNPEKD